MKDDKLTIAIFALIAAVGFVAAFFLMSNPRVAVEQVVPVVEDYRMRLEVIGAVRAGVAPTAAVVAVTATPAKTKPAKKPAMSYVVYDAKFDTEEKAAQFKAEMNAQRADCLRQAVDFKMNIDEMRGEITDWGNVITAPICLFENL